MRTRSSGLSAVQQLCRSEIVEAMDPCIPLVREFASDIEARLVRRAIRELQRMTTAGLSGDDSGLENTWEEICVQVQHEQSVFWGAYEQQIEFVVARLLKSLQPHELRALWLQTTPGSDWWIDEGDEADSVPYFEDDIVAYLREQLCSAASDWSNRRIRAHLDQATRTD